MVYFYSTAYGRASLNKGDAVPLKRLGQFANEAAALEACKAHHAKACKAAAAFKRAPPVAIYL